MTDRPIPATPEATEREARERNAWDALLSFCDGITPPQAVVQEVRAAVAAVEYERGRRAERERLVQIVEGERLTDNTGHPQDRAYNQTLDDVLSKLREAK